MNHFAKNDLISKGDLTFTVITKRDLIVALIISTGCFGVGIGIVGAKNLYVSTLFFIVPLVVTLILFLFFKPKEGKAFSDRKWDY